MSQPSVNLDNFLSVIQQRLTGKVVGYACVVGDASGKSLRYSWGAAQTTVDASPAMPFETWTQLGVASVSKLFDAIAAVQLLEGWQANLDTPMYLALPKGWTVQDPAVKLITFRQLLTHTSGLVPANSQGEPQQDFASLQAYLSLPKV